MVTTPTKIAIQTSRTAQLPERLVGWRHIGRVVAVRIYSSALTTTWLIPILTARPNEQEERNQSTIPKSEFDALFDLAGKYLTVNNQLFERYIRHTIVKKTLQKALPSRDVQHLPLGVRGPNSNRDYLTWAGSDTVLEIRDDTGNVVGNVTDKMLWMTETRVTYLVKGNGTIRAAVVRDYNKDSDILVIAKVLYVVVPL